jgi:hypothetical protein
MVCGETVTGVARAWDRNASQNVLFSLSSICDWFSGIIQHLKKHVDEVRLNERLDRANDKPA